MSIKDLFQPNQYDLFCNDLTANNLVFSGVSATSFTVGPPGPLIVNGVSIINGSQTVSGLETVNSLDVVMNAGVGGDFSVAGNQSLAGTLTAGNIQDNGTLSVVGAVNFPNTMTVGNIQDNGNLTVVATTTLQGVTNFGNPVGLSVDTLGQITDDVPATFNSTVQMNGQLLLNSTIPFDVVGNPLALGDYVGMNMAFTLVGDNFNPNPFILENTVAAGEPTVLHTGIVEIRDVAVNANAPAGSLLALNMPNNLIVAGGTNFIGCFNAASALPNGIVFQVQTDGSVLNNGTFIVSSEDYKQNIASKSADSKLLKKCNIVNYQMKGNELDQRIGLIWEEMKEICPDICKQPSNGAKAIDLGGLSSLNLCLSKDLEDRLSKCESLISMLQKQNSLLQEQLSMQSK